MPQHRTPLSRSELRERYLPFYERLYKAYPLHQDFQGGFAALLDLLESETTLDPEFILEKATTYAQNVDPSELAYVPHLKSWIRNRRFEDEDLFTDQIVALREWFTGVWRRGDAQAVVKKYGFIYNHAPVPEGVDDLDAWHADQRKLWIAKVANHLLNGKEPPE